MDKYTVTRHITPAECDWLKETVLAGTVVEATGDLFGCCAPGGIMVKIDGRNCSVELPESALRPCSQVLN